MVVVNPAADLLQYSQLQPTLMRFLLPILIAVAGISAANATAAHLEGWVAAEQAEICHRSGSLDCPPLPR